MSLSLWILCRYLRGVWGVLEKYFYANLMKDLVSGKNESIIAPMLTILLFLVTEIIPIMFVLDWSFMEIFTMKLGIIIP